MPRARWVPHRRSIPVSRLASLSSLAWLPERDTIPGTARPGADARPDGLDSFRRHTAGRGDREGLQAERLPFTGRTWISFGTALPPGPGGDEASAERVSLGVDGTGLRT